MANTLKEALDLISFHQMEAQHQKEWLYFEQSKYDERIKIVARHKDDCLAIERVFYEKLAHGEFAKQYLAEKLDALIKIHEQHKVYWQEFYKKYHEEASRIVKKHNDEFDAFKKSLTK